MNGSRDQQDLKITNESHVDPDYDLYSKNNNNLTSIISPQYQFILDRAKRHLSHYTPIVDGKDALSNSIINHASQNPINLPISDDKKRLSKKEVAFFRQKKEEKRKRRKMDWLK